VKEKHKCNNMKEGHNNSKEVGHNNKALHLKPNDALCFVRGIGSNLTPPNSSRKVITKS
jgi:hypothetical protein